MTQKCQENVLFPEEIIPWDGIVKLVTHLRIPFRHRASGIECIVGGVSSFFPPSDTKAFWFPVVLGPDDWKFIENNLNQLPKLRFPTPPEIATDFVDKFILIKDSPNFVPNLLTSAHLSGDKERRDILFTQEKEQLEQLLLENDVFLIDSARKKCKILTQGVYFSRQEAIQYLGKKGLLDIALSGNSSWHKQLCEPEIAQSTPISDEIYFGFSQELNVMGLQDYRRTQIFRHCQAMVHQIAQLNPEPADIKLIGETDSIDTTTSTDTEQFVSEGNKLIHDSITNAPPLADHFPSYTDEEGNTHPLPTTVSVALERDKEEPIKENFIVEVDTGNINEQISSEAQLIGMKEVMEILNISRQTVYNFIKPNSPSYNPNFPKPRGLNSVNKWNRSEINEFARNLPSKKHS